MNEMKVPAGNTAKKMNGISGSTLKFIALFAMLIDHTAAIILDRILLGRGLGELTPDNIDGITSFMEYNANIYYISTAMRLIGRIAFPIFCFLLVEGFIHTSNIKKYAINLGIFALISEIPFDLAFRNTIFETRSQNVFFTLFLGLMVIIGFRYVDMKYADRKTFKNVLYFVFAFIGMYLGFALRTDYYGVGVVAIAAMYLFRRRKLMEGAVGCTVLCSMTNALEITSFFSLIPIHLYNGTRGLKLKYLFYIFYPAHILILHLITVLMGVA